MIVRSEDDEEVLHHERRLFFFQEVERDLCRECLKASEWYARTNDRNESSHARMENGSRPFKRGFNAGIPATTEKMLDPRDLGEGVINTDLTRTFETTYATSASKKYHLEIPVLFAYWW